MKATRPSPQITQIFTDFNRIPRDYFLWFDAFLTESCKEENLSAARTQKVIENFLFAERQPIRDEAIGLID